jgi:hypothetical protein
VAEFEQKILDELHNLRKAVEALRSDFTISQITYFENLPAAAVVGVDYVSYRFGCSETAVIRGRFGTDDIPRLRSKPIAFIKRDVDAVWQKLNKSTSELAAKIRHKANNKTLNRRIKKREE